MNRLKLWWLRLKDAINSKDIYLSWKEYESIVQDKDVEEFKRRLRC